MRYLAISIFTFCFIYSPVLLPDPIPADIIYAPPQRENIQISPDGKYVSYIAKDINHKKNIFIRSVGKNDDTALIPYPSDEIIDYKWSFIPEKILYFQQITAQNSIHLFLMDIKSGLIRDLTPFYGKSAKTLIVDHRVPDVIFCAIDLQGKNSYDLYSIDLKNGAIELITKLPENTINIIADIFHKLVIVSVFDKKRMRTHFNIKYPDKEIFNELLSIEFADEFNIIDFSEDGKSIYALSNINKDLLTLVRYDLEQRKEIETLISSENSDIDDLFYNRYKKSFLCAVSGFMKREIAVSDSTYKEDFDFLDRQNKGFYRLHSMDIAGEKWILSFETYDHPRVYYLYNRPDRRLQLLFMDNPAMDKSKSLKSQPFTIRFGDKEKLLLFVTLPPQQDVENFPLILNLYNPSNSKYGFEFQPICQFFASRGFACISFGYSGIMGFGKNKYLSGFNKEAIKRRLEEINTVIKWATNRNIAHPRQITILSDSINSIPVLHTIFENSDIIQTAIFIEPLFDIKTLRSTIDKSGIDFFITNRVKHLLYKNLDEKVDLLSLVKKIQIPAIFVLNQNAALYNFKRTEETIESVKKQNKDIMSVSYSKFGRSELSDFMKRVENILSKYYNTDYIEYKEIDKKDTTKR